MPGPLLRCILGKLAMGIFALPLTKNEFLTLSFAWGSWGEFSFILALRAVRGNLLEGDQAAKIKAIRVGRVGWREKEAKRRKGCQVPSSFGQ